MSLATLAKIIGAVIVVANFVAVIAPGFFRRALNAFPRNRLAAWVLIATDLFWVAWIILHAHLGRFEGLKPFVYAAGPIGFLLIVFFMDELLAPRGLGGLLLLVCDPVLDAARWHPSDWRYVMTVLAYLWVIAGITLILSPYRFRKVAEFMTRTDQRTRVLGAARLALGLLVLSLGLFVY